MQNGQLSIGELSALSGCKLQTIRYYERIGLLAPAARTGGNQRRFWPEHLERLNFVRHCRELGFSLDAVRELLLLCDNPKQSCMAADRIARQQLQDVGHRISRLKHLRSELQRMIESCRGGAVAECNILKALSNQPDSHDKFASGSRPDLNRAEAYRRT